MENFKAESEHFLHCIFFTVCGKSPFVIEQTFLSGTAVPYFTKICKPYRLSALLNFVLIGNPSRSSTADITIHLDDINDNRPVFKEQSMTLDFHVNDLYINDKLYTAEATDADTGVNALIVYSLDGSAGATDTFSVDSASGVITLIADPQLAMYKLTITASDGDPIHTDSMDLLIHIDGLATQPAPTETPVLSPSYQSTLMIDSTSEPSEMTTTTETTFYPSDTLDKTEVIPTLGITTSFTESEEMSPTPTFPTEVSYSIETIVYESDMTSPTTTMLTSTESRSVPSVAPSEILTSTVSMISETPSGK